MEQQEFTDLYDQYVDKVYAFIYRRVNHQQNAEDLTSRTFIKAWENIDKFNSGKGAFSSWIFTIAKNNVIDHYRSAKETYDIEQFFDLSSSENLANQTEMRSTIEEVKKYLEQLTPEQKEIIVMRIWDDFSFKEIAAVLNKNEAAIKMNFYRAMQKVQSEFAILALILLISGGK